MGCSDYEPEKLNIYCNDFISFTITSLNETNETNMCPQLKNIQQRRHIYLHNSEKCVNYLNNRVTNGQECFTHCFLEQMYRWAHSQLTTGTETQLSAEDAALLAFLPLTNPSTSYIINAAFIAIKFSVNQLYLMLPSLFLM